MYLHTSVHPVRADMIRHQSIHYVTADRARMEGVIIVILCALYCNVFSLVNETQGNLTTMHSALHPRPSLIVHVFWRRRGFGE